MARVRPSLSLYLTLSVKSGTVVSLCPVRECVSLNTLVVVVMCLCVTLVVRPAARRQCVTSTLMVSVSHTGPYYHGPGWKLCQRHRRRQRGGDHQSNGDTLESLRQREASPPWLHTPPLSHTLPTASAFSFRCRSLNRAVLC